MKRLILFLAVLLAVATVFAENITVVTLDVWSGLTYRGLFRVSEYEDRATREFRYDLLVKGLQSLSPDVIALQEANPLPAYASRIAEDMGYDVHSEVRQAGVRIGVVGLPTNLREGSLILADTGLALSGLSSTQLSGPRAGNLAAFQFGAGSELVGAQIDVEDRPVFVFTTRWTPSPYAERDRLVTLVDEFEDGRIEGNELVRLMNDAVSGSERRQEESRRTLVSINEVAGEQPVILMGSFHALPDSEEIRMLRDAGFVDVWQAVGRGSGYTYDSTSNSNIAAYDLAPTGTTRERIDYIFIRGDGIAARSAALVFSRSTYGVHTSDHYGLMAEIRIDPR
jgi:endonuclease/exonuclease/phosphatase family metal-dependent hydrolase